MIPIADPEVGAAEILAVRDVVSDARFVAGEEVSQFESAFADYVGTDHAVGTTNGTSALHTALEAVGIGEGDRVITTPFSFVATANAIRFAGARPVFADVDPETLNLDPDRVEEILEDEGAEAILVVHLYGLPARMDRFEALAERYDLALIEDAAQAHGATIDGRQVGSIGDVGCFSFYPTKNMTTGEGGIVVTDDADVTERARQFINHGRAGSDTHVRLGHNYRMPNVAGAIGLAQLDRLPDFLDRRRHNAERLRVGLDGTALDLPPRRSNRRHAFHQFTVRSDERDALRDALGKAGVQTGVYYPTPIHQQPAYDEWDVRLPVAESAAEEVLSLPVHPGLSDADVDAVIDAVGAHLGRAREVRSE